MIEKIAQNIVFNGVKPETIQNIINIASPITRYEHNIALIEPQFQEQDAFFILSGTVRLSLLSEDGDVVSYNDVQENDFFGWLSMLDGKERLTSAITETPCAIAKIPGAQFKKILFTDDILMSNFMVRVASVIRDYTQRIEDLSILSVKNRILNEINKRNKGGSNIVTLGTHEEFSSWLGASRETVTRILRELEADAILKRTGRDYEILDNDKITKWGG